MELTNKEITVYLDDQQAKMFVLFQEQYENIALMLKSKVFEQKGATITLNFDTLGKIKNIKRSDVLYDENTDFVNENPKSA